MAENFRDIGKDQGWSTGRTEITETSQQNHQTCIQSTTNRTSPESEQYTREFIDSIYHSLNGTKASMTKGKQKARCFKSTKTAITNISSYSLSEAERSLLRRGLNFIPTPPKEHPAKILQDYLLFDHKLRLTYYFEDKDSKPQETKQISILKQSTGWTPPGSQDQNFDSYRHLTQGELLNELNIAPKYKRFNLPKSERKAIKSLANNDRVTINPADKGGKIVIQDTSDYIKECERQLHDTTYYRRLYLDPTQKLNKVIKSKLEKGVQDGNISPAEFEALYNPDPRILNFYTLPKIHKTNNPGCPIVNSIGSITEKIST